jgi:polyvinyl alcohol dehydrogenase (cytochrome)
MQPVRRNAAVGARSRVLLLALAAIAISLLGITPLRAEPATLPLTKSQLEMGENYAIGKRVYQQTCAGCHDTGMNRAPQPTVLRNMRPASIYRVLTTGVMRAMAANLTDKERVAVSEYVAERKLVADTPPAPSSLCTGQRAQFDREALPAQAGWGFDLGNSHAVSAQAARVTRADLGKLKLKWAYGFADSNRARSQPSLAGGAIFTGSHNGHVIALDRATGCERWRYEARAEVRTGVVIAPWQRGDAAVDPLAFFGDLSGNVYAVKAFTGEPVWTVRADTHTAAIITATPALFAGTLFVPISSLEESAAGDPNYPCCTFRGSIVALDALTGKEKWRTFMVDPPQRREGDDGRSGFGPSGVAVWNTPAIDPKRGLLYAATGDNYSSPTTSLSDAVIALDIATGRIVWAHQATEGDAWNVGCYLGAANCPQDAGPDFDFGAGVILARGPSGSDVVLAGQKSGVAYAFDADTGKQVWRRRVGRGGLAGGTLFGIAAQGGKVFVPITDFGASSDTTFPASPGLYALDVASGELAWSAPMANTCVPQHPDCFAGISGAITATPDFVIAGGDDGRLRAYAADSGAVLLDMDLLRSFETVNGVAASGGAMSGGAAPIVDGGQIIVASGYGHAMKMAGNVLLVFEAQ